MCHFFDYLCEKFENLEVEKMKKYRKKVVITSPRRTTEMSTRDEHNTFITTLPFRLYLGDLLKTNQITANDRK